MLVKTSTCERGLKLNIFGIEEKNTQKSLAELRVYSLVWFSIYFPNLKTLKFYLFYFVFF